MIGLMCNLTEHSAENRRKILAMRTPYIDYERSETTPHERSAIVALTRVRAPYILRTNEQ